MPTEQPNNNAETTASPTEATATSLSQRSATRRGVLSKLVMTAPVIVTIGPQKALAGDGTSGTGSEDAACDTEEVGV